MKFLIGALPHNQHLANIALALAEANRLVAFHTGSVDHYSADWIANLRAVLGRAVPSLDRRMQRRRIPNLPPGAVHAHRGWDDIGILAKLAGFSESFQDAIWERREMHFDRLCAKLMEDPQFTAFLGVEFGSLNALQAAHRLGKKSIVGFLSPHHSALDRWVWPEYEKFPELLTPYVRRLIRTTRVRAERKDQEARLADCVHTASEFTAGSLAATGVPRSKMTLVPLGSPPAIPASELPSVVTKPVRILYSGPVSVRKGAHYLLSAWRALGQTPGAELHLYGAPLLPEACLQDVGPNVFVHGHVSKQEILQAYAQASILVFPTLCDGFGMVVAEAMSRGTPVIATPNAGAAHLIEEYRTGFLVPPADEEALASRLDWCIRHPSDLHDMRPLALAKARDWTWADFRREFLQQSSAILGSMDVDVN